MDLAPFEVGLWPLWYPEQFQEFQLFPGLFSEPQAWQGSRVINGADTTKFSFNPPIKVCPSLPWLSSPTSLEHVNVMRYFQMPLAAEKLLDSPGLVSKRSKLVI